MIMESETESLFNDYYFDENRECEFLSDRDDDLMPPKQKRVFVKMLAKLIRCANCAFCRFFYRNIGMEN